MADPTNAGKVTVYTMHYCPYCEAAKALLKRRGVDYREILVEEEDDAEWDRLFKLSGMKTMPQIFVSDGSGEHLIGGHAELKALDQRDELQSLK